MIGIAGRGKFSKKKANKIYPRNGLLFQFRYWRRSGGKRASNLRRDDHLSFLISGRLRQTIKIVILWQFQRS